MDNAFKCIQYVVKGRQILRVKAHVYRVISLQRAQDIEGVDRTAIGFIGQALGFIGQVILRGKRHIQMIQNIILL